MKAMRYWGLLAGLSGASAVLMASWASHGLAHTVPPHALALALTRAHAATQQHWVHTLALLGIALWCAIGSKQSTFWLHVAGSCFASGIVLFSLGIYVLHIWWPNVGTSMLRYAVPAGGIAFVLGWLSLACAAWAYGSSRPDCAR